jgi:hypothetical protein
MSNQRARVRPRKPQKSTWRGVCELCFSARGTTSVICPTKRSVSSAWASSIKIRRTWEDWLPQVDDLRTFLAHFVSAVQQSNLPAAIGI